MINYDTGIAFSKKYVIWFLVPILIAYGLDFLQLMLSGIQLVVSLIVAVQFGTFGGGAVYAIWAMFPERDVTNLFNMRWNKYLPTFGWGFQLVNWLLEAEEVEEVEETQDGESHET